MAFTLAIVVHAAQAQSTTLHYAGNPGRSWSYDNGVAQTLTGPRPFEGLQVMLLTHYLAGEPVSEDTLTFDEAGVRLWATANAGAITRFDPPLLLYPPPPLARAVRWSSTSSTDRGFTMRVDAEVIGQRTITTPAGRFDVWQIRRTTTTSTGAHATLDLFFAPEVGVVRYLTAEGEGIDLIEASR